ncbi:hypothetical protein ERM67_17410 [Clostridioides difficile]|nr:hypothetical protein [Clostridioides difficile]EGT3754415.1 hypothetical protein [Clostridioides difficile]EGT3851336.1 hypothetical protein [Clostridioides difficile]EGT3870294.1 hypothetical protein [Clostridioides difficile]EGT3942938.1 hypothetical protein [Clostridioides difficile]
MEGGDYDASVAHYCLHKFKWKPHEYTDLPDYERAFVAASIDIKVEEEIKEEKKTAKEARRSRRR